MTTRTNNLSTASIGLAFLVVVGGAIWFGVGNTTGPMVDQSDISAAGVVRGSSVLSVHVSGPVATPGVVEVPEGSRVADAIAAAGGATADADLGTLNLAAEVRDGQTVRVPSVLENLEGTQGPGPFDINTADQTRMEELPGVGPVLAARIVSYREENGPFAAIEDLLEIPGIGEAKLASIRDAIDSR
jgi:competence protein ComEA